MIHMTTNDTTTRTDTLAAVIKNKLDAQKLDAQLRQIPLTRFKLQVYDDQASPEVKADLRSYFAGDPCYANDEVITRIQALGYVITEDRPYSDQESQRYFPRSWVINAPATTEGA